MRNDIGLIHVTRDVALVYWQLYTWEYRMCMKNTSNVRKCSLESSAGQYPLMQSHYL